MEENYIAIAAAHFVKTAIAILAIARFRKRATAIPSPFFPLFVYFSLHFIFFLSPFSISFIFIYFSICFSSYFISVSSSALPWKHAANYALAVARFI